MSNNLEILKSNATSVKGWCLAAESLERELDSASVLDSKTVEKVGEYVKTLKIMQQFSTIDAQGASEEESKLNAEINGALSIFKQKVEGCLSRIEVLNFPKVPANEPEIPLDQRTTINTLTRMRNERDSAGEKVVKLHSSIDHSKTEKKELESELVKGKEQIELRNKMSKKSTISGQEYWNLHEGIASWMIHLSRVESQIKELDEKIDKETKKLEKLEASFTEKSNAFKKALGDEKHPLVISFFKEEAPDLSKLPKVPNKN